MAHEPILVVDDNPANLKLVSYLLTARGYRVRSATCADEVFAELERFVPRLILMDLQLPGIDGFEITRRLKADPSRKDIVVIAVTAYAMKGDAARALDAGCDDYVAKPIDTRGLPGLLRRHLDGARPVEAGEAG